MESDDAQTHELEELTPADTPYAGAAAPVPAAARKGFPQMYRFFWGAAIVFVGTLLPFGPAIVSSMVDEPEHAPKVAGLEDPAVRKSIADSLGVEQPAEQAPAEPAAAAYPLAGRPGYHTFLGALFLVFSLLCMGQMWAAIRDRKVALGAVLLMLIPTGWAWTKLFQARVTGGIEDFSWGGLVFVGKLEEFAQHVGSGFLLVLLGGTFLAISFLMAVFGAAKKPAAQAAPATRARPRRR
jgi:hypothetical protein